VETYNEISINDWNGHPIDVSPARFLLIKLGFTKSDSRHKSFVYDGFYKPDAKVREKAESEMSDIFEHLGKEKAPVAYNAEWTISRSPATVQSKMAELIQFLKKSLPEDCDFVYRPREMSVRYRGMRCIHPNIQQKQIRLHIAYRGWTPGIPIEPETDLDSSEFLSQFWERFEKVKSQIDSELGAKRS